MPERTAPNLVSIAAAAASLALIAAAPPKTADFANAAEFATALVAENGPPTVRDLEIVTPGDPGTVSIADYRAQRLECELSRLIRVQGESDIGLEWRCGPLGARVSDVYRIGERGVARIVVGVPFLVTAPRVPTEPR